jgi:hypothetical protein
MKLRDILEKLNVWEEYLTEVTAQRGDLHIMMSIWEVNKTSPSIQLVESFAFKGSILGEGFWIHILIEVIKEEERVDKNSKP